MTDLSTMMGTDPAPDTTEPAGVPGVPPPGVPGSDPGVTAGVHPLDQSVPVQDGRLVEPDRPPSTGPDQLGPQGVRTKAPWSTSNEDAIPINQRAPHDWFGSTYTPNATGNNVTRISRLKGCKKTVLSIPAVANVATALPVIIAQDEGDVNQGAGVELYPGEAPLIIESEGPIFIGVVGANATGGPVRVIRFIDPPGGGLGLSAS